MSDPLTEQLREREWLLADGATGTSLFAMGLEAGEAPEIWNDSEPERVYHSHREFVEAGADLILTNSFGGNRYRLRLHGRDYDAEAINRRAAEIARDAATLPGRNVIVAGSIGPTGEILEPLGPLLFFDAVEAFEEQGAALMEGGADILWGETISSKGEAAAIAEAAHRLQAPYALTLSFDTARRTMMGYAPGEFQRAAKRYPSPAAAIGSNCGTGAPDLLASLLEFDVGADNLPLIAKANAGIPEFLGTEIVYSGTPKQMARFACLARDIGARVIGGCCGTTAEHLRAMREALTSTPRRGRPTLDEIVAATGSFQQIVPTSGVPVGRRGRRRGAA